MNPSQTSFLVMIVGLLTALFMIAYKRPGWKKASAAVFTGLVVGLANMALEYYAYKHKIYFVFGLLPIGHSSLALTIGWVSLTACFLLGSESLREASRPGRALAIYIMAGIIAGIFSDYLGEIATFHFRMGPQGSWLYISLIWISLVPAAMLIYKVLLWVLG